MNIYKSELYCITVEQFHSLLNELDITDPEECDQMAALIALHFFTAHCANKDIDWKELDKQKLEAHAYCSMILHKIIDYLDYVSERLKEEC